MEQQRARLITAIVNAWKVGYGRKKNSYLNIPLCRNLLIYSKVRIRDQNLHSAVNVSQDYTLLYSRFSNICSID